MQGKVIFRDTRGNKLWEGDSTQFPLTVECETFIGQQNFIVRYSFLEDAEKKGWKDRNKIKGIVMMKK